MEWVETAETYCGSYGWGARGKNIGVSRMFQDAEVATLQRTKLVASSRPRGELSGFLAIVPTLGYAVFLPPIAAKMGPLRFRIRVSQELLEKGAVFSAYVTRRSERTLILEDVLAWKGQSVWHTKPFEERWNHYMQLFVAQEWKNDPVVQTIPITLAQYTSIQLTAEPDEASVIEFVPNAPNTKRMIWIPPKDSLPPKVPQDSLQAKREAAMGPDVYSVWRGAERLGIALVRTLAISRALRAATGDTIPIAAIWNKQFEKWDIQSVGTK